MLLPNIQISVLSFVFLSTFLPFVYTTSQHFVYLLLCLASFLSEIRCYVCNLLFLITALSKKVIIFCSAYKHLTREVGDAVTYVSDIEELHFLRVFQKNI